MLIKEANDPLLVLCHSIEVDLHNVVILVVVAIYQVAAVGVVDAKVNGRPKDLIKLP